MGVEMLEMVVKMRKIVIFTTRRCYRAVCSHPFLVGMLCFFVFLYRSSPFVFSLLVSASPVLVCTAVLLGTLLTFGQPNIPEIERDEQTTHEIASLKTGVTGDAIVVKSYSAEKFTDERGDVVEQLSGVASSIANRSSEHHRGDSVDSGDPLIEERSREMEFEIRAVAEEGRKIHDEAYEQKDEIDDERLVDGEAKADDEDLELENDKSPAESFDSERVNVDSLDSPPGSPWKHVEEGEEREEEEEDDEAIDSGSDGAESSSPDASMADIIPLLDELHPLLDEDAPQPVSLSHDGSDAASERSLKSSDSSSESDDNKEKHEDMEVADEDNEDADDDDEAQGNREGQTKSAITWTEEDQKNLMDLGTSELERNQRLESLIARRRARKTMSMMPERNLIDLDSADLPFNIAPISTARNNPFDFHYDSYNNMGLPPIPGSAPSILLPRRNPFDLPYDSSEEKLDLMGDSFQQEFTPFQPKEPFFQRHESFNVGPSFFGPSRQERQGSRLRPYFVTERMDSDGASYLSFQRQSRGLSDSKASSVPETDSVASAGDIEEKNLFEETISHQAEPLSSVPEIQLKDPDENVDDKNLSEEDISHELDLISLKEDKSPSEEGISPEQELISNIEHVSQHVGHGSQSSEETASLELGEDEKKDVEANEMEIGLRHLEDHHEGEQVLSGEVGVPNPMQFNANETHSNAETVKHGYRSTSSSSSLSEVSERIFSEREAEGLPNFVERSDHIVEEAGISAQRSQGGSDLNMTGDTPQKEPVFDSSPPAIRKNLSSSSMSSDLHVEPEMPPIVIKTTISFAERESESGNQVMKKNTPDDNDMSALVLLPINENQSEYGMVTEISDKLFMQFDLSGADQVSNSTSAPVVPESNVSHASSDSNSSQDTAIEGHLMYQQGSEYQADQSFSSVDADVHLVVHNVVPPSVECIATSSEDQKLAQSSEPPSLSAEQVLLVNVPYTTSQSTAEQSVDKEIAFQPELGPGLSLISDTDVGDGDCIEPEEEQISVHDQSTCEEKLIAEYGEELVFLDKPVDETSSRDNHEEETAVTPEERIEELSSIDNSNIPDAQELEQEVSLNMNSPTSPESISILSEAYESRAAEGYSDVESNSVHDFGNDDRLRAIEDSKFSAEATASQVNLQNIDDDADEIKEIDEVLLSELDAVGDFSIQELRSTSNEFENVASIEDGLSASQVTIRNASVLDDDFTKIHENESELHMMNVRASQGDDVTQYVEVKCVSEPQTPRTRLTEHTNLSGASSMEEVQNYIDSTSTHKEMLPSQNQMGLANFRVVQNSNAEEVNPQMPLIEARSLEDIEAIFKKSELTSAEKEINLGSTEIFLPGQANEASSSGIPVLEARTLLDIDSAFKQMSVKIIEKPNISESLSAKPALEETSALGSQYNEQHEGSSLTKLKMKLTIRTAIPVEDADFDVKQPNKVNAERDMLPDSVDDGLHVGEIKDSEQSSSELPVIQTRSLNDPSLALTQASEYQQDKGLQSSAELFEENVAGTSRHLQSSANKLGVQEVRNSADENTDNSSESPESLTTDDARKVGGSSHKSS